MKFKHVVILTILTILLPILSFGQQTSNTYPAEVNIPYVNPVELNDTVFNNGEMVYVIDTNNPNNVSIVFGDGVTPGGIPLQAANTNPPNNDIVFCQNYLSTPRNFDESTLTNVNNWSYSMPVGVGAIHTAISYDGKYMMVDDCGYSGYKSSKIWYSQNYGGSWTNIYIPTNVTGRSRFGIPLWMSQDGSTAILAYNGICISHNITGSNWVTSILSKSAIDQSSISSYNNKYEPIMSATGDIILIPYFVYNNGLNDFYSYYKSTDYGQTWTTILSTNMTIGNICGMSWDGTLFMMGQYVNQIAQYKISLYNQLVYTKDLGNHLLINPYNSTPLGGGNSWSGLGNMTLSANGKCQYFYNSLVSDLLISTNYGQSFSWTNFPITAPAPYHITVSADGQYAIFANSGANGSIADYWYTSNYGQTWTDIVATASDCFGTISMSGNGKYILATSGNNGGVYIGMASSPSNNFEGLSVNNTPVLLSNGSASGLTGCPSGAAPTGTFASVVSTQQQQTATISAVSLLASNAVTTNLVLITNFTSISQSSLLGPPITVYMTNNLSINLSSMSRGEQISLFVAHSTSNQVLTWPNGLILKTTGMTLSDTNTTGFADLYSILCISTNTSSPLITNIWKNTSAH